ncbi:hypothetical protein HK405_006492, partial [Cladochytrium tenue]
MALWDGILTHLLAENLHGPASSAAVGGAPPPSPAGGLNGGGLDAPNPAAWPGALHSPAAADDRDLDADDPRWLEMFVRYFLELDSSNDDLLFFVRGPDDDLDVDDADPIFVRRKVDKAMPQLGAMVDWKQTFFLNLIIQLPCILTVAVCKRVPAAAAAARDSGDSKPAAAASDEKDTASISTSGSSPGLRPPPLPRDGGRRSRSATREGGAKSRMVALRRVTKKVYAAPYKSRMDVKDAFMNECSYPLVFYTVNDYESHDLHLAIWEREYLCVELSVLAPVGSAGGSGTGTGTGAGEEEDYQGAAEAVAAISLEDDSSPFPTPRGFAKVVLFQGAVPYAALLDIFLQKGQAGHGLLHHHHQQHHRGWGHSSAAGVRTEYIMMRGPHGKGQCQVAIRENHSDETDSTAPGGGGGGGGGGSGGGGVGSDWAGGGAQAPSWLRSLGSSVRAAVAGISQAPSAGAQPDPTATRKKPESLRCSMTFVNVPWQSII